MSLFTIHLPDYLRPNKNLPEEYKGSLALHKAVHDLGVMEEIAKQARKELSKRERRIIEATRKVAEQEGWSLQSIRFSEMEGERDKSMVGPRIKIVLKFSHYNSGEHPTFPRPEYVIAKSNHPAYRVGEIVDEDTAKDCEFSIPKTMSFEDWVAGGRKCFRDRKST